MSKRPEIEGQPPAKRVKLSSELADEKGTKAAEKEETVARYTPKSTASIEGQIRCLLIEYLISPDFLANAPPANFVYYRPLEDLVLPYIDMNQYDPLQFRPPVQLPHPFYGIITSHIFNVLCDVTTLNHPDITHLQCWMSTFANARHAREDVNQLNRWMMRGIKFNVVALNRKGQPVTRQNWVKDFEEKKGLYLRRVDDVDIRMELTILEDQIWMAQNGVCPKIQTSMNWPALVGFVRSSVQRAFTAKGELVSDDGKIEGIDGRGYVDASGIMVI
ncbi:hypothetical protein HYALB_00013703 [Hymenoscyphus albidus]|uniref:Uncharacterized protein n=1 Tax=Hymenoscyphus albidus TaxID=595503 RepID=A0A9N9M380_9HELO|nr:hypothetical protein HYALB_00013703 [Hymenoscyphus albidus]